ncbi:unnamed protein product [Symbiodinium microadriaticum]|nr:unnamed protein product [Symbiodinium microadriaticum]
MPLLTMAVRPQVVFSADASPKLRRLGTLKELQQPVALSRICTFGLASLALTARPEKELSVRREHIELPNQALLGVDWIGDSSEPEAILLVFPGIGTNSRRGFAGMIAHHMAKTFTNCKVGVGVMQGHDELPLQSACLPATAYVGMGDIGHILEHVSKKSTAPLVVVGCSIGAAHFTRWAGMNPEKLQEYRVQGAVLVCHGHSSRPAATAVDASGAAPFILAAYRDIVRRCADLEVLATSFPGFEPEKLRRARSLREWDEALLPVYGFTEHDHVMDAVDTTPSMLEQLPIPVIFLGAGNDPITPSTRLLDGQVQKLVKNSAVIHLSHGSHMAWWEGPPWALHQSWACRLMAEAVGTLTGLAVPPAQPPPTGCCC